MDKAASTDLSAEIAETTKICETKAKARMEDEKVPTALPRPEPPVVRTPKDNGTEGEPVPHRLRNRWQ